MSTECNACGAYTESVSEELKHADNCPYVEVWELQAALNEANARNREIAALIIDNDRTEAVKWAKGLMSSFDGGQYQVRVDDAAGVKEDDEGEIVVTWNTRGEIVLVSRQDDEGRILKIIAEKGKPPAHGVREGGNG